MYDFVSHVLRRYFEATGWNEHNSYLNLHATSSALLDFPTPPGVSFSVSSRPSPPFFTSYHLHALPVLQGSIGYMFTRVQGKHGAALDIGQSSGQVGLQRMMERFQVPPLPASPAPQEAQENSHVGDYLIYGSVHIPSYRVDGLYSWRFSDSMQAIVTASSAPPKVPFVTQLAHLAGLYPEYDGVYSGSLGSSSFALGSASHWATPTNVQLLLQRDTGSWCTEYSYSVDDDLWGFRVLHNFSVPGSSSSASAISTSPPPSPPSLPVSEETLVTSDPLPEPLPHGEGEPRDRLRVPFAEEVRALFSEDGSWAAGRGLRGRFSAGAEMFFSRARKSAGLSTGIRFATLPDDEPDPCLGPLPGPELQQPPQPPTILTATLNPLLGHLSMSYAARMAQDVAACSRFDFNVYSYDSELTVGLEYWMRTPQAGLARPPTEPLPSELAPTEVTLPFAPVSETATESRQALALDSMAQDSGADHMVQDLASARNTHGVARLPDDVLGLLKLRLSSTADMALLWESRLRNSLISAGFQGNLNNRARPIASVGVELMYFSS